MGLVKCDLIISYKRVVRWSVEINVKQLGNYVLSQFLFSIILYCHKILVVYLIWFEFLSPNFVIVIVFFASVSYWSLFRNSSSGLVNRLHLFSSLHLPSGSQEVHRRWSAMNVLKNFVGFCNYTMCNFLLITNCCLHIFTLSWTFLYIFPCT